MKPQPQTNFPRGVDVAPYRADFAAGFDPMELQVSQEVNNCGVQIEFFLEKLEREPITNEDGSIEKREPLEVECCRLKIAGDVCNQATLPVDDGIRKRFQTEYAAWKGDVEALATASRRATPLRTWAEMPSQLADDLARRHIVTIEHLAHLPDSAVSLFAFGRMWRDKALGYLAKANEDARFTELRDENAALHASLDAVTAEMEKLRRAVLGETGPGLNGAKKDQ
jgi:hypothetical protein